MSPRPPKTASQPAALTRGPDLARRRCVFATALGAGAALAGCGGGGGGGEAAPPVAAARRYDAPLVYGVLQAGGGQQLFRYRPEGPPVALAPQFAGGVDQFELTPDGRSVVCVARETAAAPARLWRIDLDAPGNAVRLSPLPGSGLGRVRVLRLSPDGEHVAFTGDLNTPNVVEVYVAPVRGTTVLRVSAFAGNPATLEYDLPFPEAWSPDGRYLLQGVRTLLSNRRIGLNVYDRFGGPDSTRLSGLLQVPNTHIGEARWLRDSSGIVYVAQVRSPQIQELLLARLSSPMAPWSLLSRLRPGLTIRRLEVSPDSRTVYFLSNEARDRDDLYRVGLSAAGGASGPPQPLGAPRTAANGPVLDHVLSPDGAHIAYLSDEQSIGTVQLLEVPAGAVPGAPSTVMNAPLPAGTAVGRVLYAPDGASLVYRAGTDVPAVGEPRHDLFVVPRSAPTRAQRLNGPVVANGSVDFDFTVGNTPRGTAAVYAGDLLSDRSRELFFSFLDAPGSSARLNDTLAASSRIGAWSTL